MEQYIYALVDYALSVGLIEEEDVLWARNRILSAMGETAFREKPEQHAAPIHEVLDKLCDAAAEKGLLEMDSITCRDLFDTELMGLLTPRPSQVISTFREKYEADPKAATDWYYQLSCDTNYIRRDRIAKDVKWVTSTPYGDLDITINLSKPEKDPKAIAAALTMKNTNYPACQLCAENEGYSGHLNHPARQNHRVIPVMLDGDLFYFQYSPYVYYNEHSIVFNRKHIPMHIDRDAFRHLLAFVEQFPHYFLGSNADLPIVGGSILTHDHFQGGCYTFPMERAAVETPVTIPGYEDVSVGIVNWPMSVLRLRCGDKGRIQALSEHILKAWRDYTDEAAFIFSHTRGVPHNTITPIARRREGDFEMDLVLRNNITTPEHPLGVYHPHAELHHIKKENIGLIEVMGLAVLPARLKTELALVAEGLVNGTDLRADPATASHADWAAEVKAAHPELNGENVMDILQDEVGKVFARVLEDAGVYKRTPEGREAFLRFVSAL